MAQMKNQTKYKAERNADKKPQTGLWNFGKKTDHQPDGKNCTDASAYRNPLNPRSPVRFHTKNYALNILFDNKKAAPLLGFVRGRGFSAAGATY